jgi:hypothetical protein
MSEPVWNCADDPIGRLKQMFVDILQRQRIELGQNPAQRTVFRQTHGIVHGRFEIPPGLAADLRVGVFGASGYDAWVRFSSDTDPAMPNLKATCGVGMKLFGVPGAKLIGDGDTQDFLLQNHPVFLVDNAQQMCELTAAGVISGDYKPFLHAHPTAARILREMEGTAEASALTATYWSVLPYAFGPGRFVKYKLEPEQASDGVPGTDPDYLARDLTRRLRDGEVRFRFLVQFQTDATSMPLDQATVPWNERDSVPVHIATLILPVQDAEARGQASYGENLAMNPWHALAEHEPQGSLSAARKAVYLASAEQRRNANGIPTREPGPPRPPSTDPLVDTTIVKASIHPAIGIARVGDSEQEFFIGPEVSNFGIEPHGFYRDATGALKRQAARFRIYGLNAEGKAVAELTAEDAEIHWSVHLANKKAAWFEYQLAQDIPEASSAPPQLLRNSSVADRASLVIDPGPRRISGRGTHGGAAHVFDTGSFLGEPVYLGELRTDDHGRLLVLGGHGKSESHAKRRAITFANNEGWHDDVSDGPVTATVHLGGRSLKVEPAWVVVAPPNYAPRQQSVRTMWDLMRDVAIKAGSLAAPKRPSLQEDIQPIFERLARLQWVNAGFAAAFGWRGSLDVVDADRIRELSRNTDDARDARRALMNQFRNFNRDGTSPVPWPWLYGDAMNLPPPPTPRQFSTLSDTQFVLLQQWADGDFEVGSEMPRHLDAVPVDRQPDVLDRAALDYCLADAFHPGCEMTWPMRLATMYSAPFRIKHAPEHWVEPEYGVMFNSDLVTLPGGPCAAQLAGGLTRWMGVPWQTDTASCRSGYEPEYDPYVPTFWPARAPNHVLTASHYDIVMDAKRPLAERLAAFGTRAAWVRPLLLTTDYTHQINRFVEDISQMGVVEPREGPKNDLNFPPEMDVENLHPKVRARLHSAPEGSLRKDPTDLRNIAKVRRFPNGLLRS